MEPMRGFPDFVTAVKTVLQLRSDFVVKIAGNDEMCYLKSPPPHSNTWGECAKNELNPWVKSGRVMFTGRLNSNDYLQFLQASDIHCYLSVDFVTSWSLLEALPVDVLYYLGIQYLESDIGPADFARHAVPPNSHTELTKG